MSTCKVRGFEGWKSLADCFRFLCRDFIHAVSWNSTLVSFGLLHQVTLDCLNVVFACYWSSEKPDWSHNSTRRACLVYRLKKTHIFWEEAFAFSYFSWGGVNQCQTLFLRVRMQLMPIFSYQNTAHPIKKLVILCFSLFLFELLILCHYLPTIPGTAQPFNVASTPQIHLLWVWVC